MKAHIDGKWYAPGNTMVYPGVREIPDEWEDILPPGAYRVPNDTPTEDEQEVQREQPTSLAELARLTAGEGQDLKRANSALKGLITKERNKRKALIEKLKEQGIDIDLDDEDDDD